MRISIYNADGGNNQENAAFNKARQYFPSRFLLYNALVWARLPRWGVSYDEMDRIVKQAFQYIQANPEPVIIDERKKPYRKMFPGTAFLL